VIATSPSYIVRARALLGTAAGGITATLIDCVVLAALVALGTGVALAAFAGAVAGAIACFVINKKLAFADPRPTTLEQVGRFSLVAVATALLMAAGMHVLVVRHGMSPIAAKLVCAVVVFAAWSYPAQRYFVFRPLAPSPRDGAAGASVSMTGRTGLLSRPPGASLA
jgi:putative flippase GtrA